MRSRVLVLAFALAACGGRTMQPAPTPPSTTGAATAAPSDGGVPSVPAAPPPTTRTAPPPRVTVQTISFPSGLELVVLPSSTPTVTLMLSLPVGSLDDRPGVAELTAQMVAAGGGANEATSRAHDLAAAGVGASIESEVLPTRTRLWVTVERPQLDGALKLMAGLVARSTLRSRRFDVLRRLEMERRAARARDDGVWVGREAASRWLFAAAPISRATAATRSELSRVRLAHVKQLYQDRYFGTGSRLVIAGDAELDTVKSRLSKRMAERWTTQVRPAPSRDLPTLPATQSPDAELPVYLVDQPGSEQAVLTAALLLAEGTPRLAPALAISSELLRDGLDGVPTDDGWLPATDVVVAGAADVGPTNLLFASVVVPASTAPSVARGVSEFFPHGLIDVPPRFERARAAALAHARAALLEGVAACKLYEWIRMLGGSNEDISLYPRQLAEMKLEDVTSVIGGKRLLPRTIIAGDLAALGSAVVSVRPTLDALDDFEPTKPRKLP